MIKTHSLFSSIPLFFSFNLVWIFVLNFVLFLGTEAFFDFGRNKSSKMRKEVCVLVLQLESKQMLSPMEQKNSNLYTPATTSHCFVFFYVWQSILMSHIDEWTKYLECKFHMMTIILQRVTFKQTTLTGMKHGLKRIFFLK